MLANCNLSSTSQVQNGAPAQSSNVVPLQHNSGSTNPFASINPFAPTNPFVSSYVGTSSAPTTPPGFTTSSIISQPPMSHVVAAQPTYLISTQTSFPSYSAVPYGSQSFSFQAPSFPMYPQYMPMTGMYAGSGAGRGQFCMNNGGNNDGRGSFGRGGGNSNGGRGNYNGGGNYGASGSRNNGGNGNQVSCQLCNKSGHTAKTCRTLSNYEGVSTNANQNQIEEKCQYCNGKGHTALGCFFIIGFPGQQNQVEEPTAMLATTNLAPQFWFADTRATNHMTNDMHFLQNVTTYPTNDAVQIGNGQGAGQDFILGTE